MKLTKRNPVAKHMNQVTRPSTHKSEGRIDEMDVCMTCQGAGEILIHYDRTWESDSIYTQCHGCNGFGYK